MPEFDDEKRKPHILIVSNDVVNVKMAGTGMRYLELARALSDYLDVTLAVPTETNLIIDGVQLVRYWEDRPHSLEVLVENSDVALISGYMVYKFPFLKTTETHLVVDLYDPMGLENLHYYLDKPIEVQDALNQQAVEVANDLVQVGDFFICGNERQRDYWMGVLVSNGRINPRTFAQDASLRALIDIVGIGFATREPANRPFLKGLDPMFPSDCRIILWGGGIWNWLDPITLIKAWPQVLSHHPEARLIFLGTRHPNPQVPHHVIVDHAEKLAAEIGEKDHTIRFIEWVDYEAREALLSESDIGVTLHPVHVETRYSLRTRVLDYMWARLPILITDGDITSEWVQTFQIGRVVKEFDVEGVSQALNSMLDSPKVDWIPAFNALRSRFAWNQVIAPLRNYCLNPYYAPDRGERHSRNPLVIPRQGRVEKVVQILREKGIKGLVGQILYHLHWLLTRQKEI